VSHAATEPDPMSLLKSVDPTSGLVVGEISATSSAEMETTLAAAAAARDDTGYRSASRRAAALADIAERLQARADDIVTTARLETGLGEARLRGELERTWRQVLAFVELIRTGDQYAALIDPADPAARPVPRPDLRRMRFPIGPVAVFAASNFPLAFSVAGGDTISALAAGCPVVCKAHPGHPATSELVAGEIAAAIAAHDLPTGTFGLVQSADNAVAIELVRDDRIEAVAFTGSTAGGRALFDAAAARPRPIPVFAEMGSSNPLVVSLGAIEERGDDVATLVGSAVVRDGGQLCTKPGLVFVPAGQERFLATLATTVTAAEAAVMLNERLMRGASAALKVLDDEKSVAALAEGSPSNGGFAVPPALYRVTADQLRARPQLADERFGPIALVVEYSDENELESTLAMLPGQLTATLHLTDEERELGETLVDVLLPRVGRLVFNGVPTGVSVSAAQHHGGPYPATTAAATTSVGTAAIERFLRPIVFQDAPDWLLPPPLRDSA
jgi:NADP-dependent aldehyde dehydrogenase